MEHDANYAVIVQQQEFILTKTQIEFDSPNYFTACFFGDFQEAQRRRLLISRDPDLFRIISDYLCGYTVLPLRKDVIPPRMSSTQALTNLRADAVFYQLDGLAKECDLLIRPNVEGNLLKNRFLILGSEYSAMSEAIGESQISSASEGIVWKTYVSEERLNQEPLTAMKKPELHTGFTGLRAIAAVERFAVSQMPGLAVAVIIMSGGTVGTSGTINSDFLQHSPPLAMEHEPEYIITVRGEEFLLTKSQIEFDSPNYFTACFFGDFREAQSRRLKLSRDPDLFRIITNYLCGYKVIPLCQSFTPKLMATATTLINLRADAAFYQLDGLIKECDAHIRPERNTITDSNRYLLLGSQYKHAQIEDIEVQITAALNRSVWRTYVSEERLNQEPLTKMEKPELHTGYMGLRTIAAIERFVTSQIARYDHRSWRLVGWNITQEHTTCDVNSKLMVVVEDLSL
ncbi:hypothetical protein CTheo_8045 [Ceratobasidium theobromae]|uniref:BTB domain-containing protein n=1 Tax=Ceratobasidium theobromae TaxID=1582974 RepID=A0A5N5QAI5_9AGAM|nr:hypothetical protein CTheo_8045 [Ceratobasidium theobromae]